MVSSGLWTLPVGTFWARAPNAKLPRLMTHYGWTTIDDASAADLLLVGSRRGRGLVPARDGQLVDVVLGTEHATHKGRLAHCLRTAGCADELQPPTFVVDREDGPDDAERAALVAHAARDPAAVWIRKPQARGRGIGVEPFTDVAAYLATHPGPGANGPELVQRYIERPLLLQGTKSEIRSYVLIACTDPLIVFYHDGTVRLTSLPFVYGDWTNPLVHVTNTYRQKTADPELYRERADALKWTLGGLGREVLSRGLTDDPDWIGSTLRPALSDLVASVIGALAPVLERRRGSFQIMGMDTILSDDLDDLWLTEMQLGPGLSVDNPVKERLIPSMLREAMGIVLEVEHRLRGGAEPAEVHRGLASVRWFRRVWPRDD